MTTSTLLDALRAGTAALPLLLATTAVAQGGFTFDNAQDTVEETDQAQDQADGQVTDINIPQDAQRVEATLDQDDIVLENGQYLSYLSMDLSRGQTFHFLIESDGFPVMLNMQDNDGNFVQVNGVGLDGRYINVTAPADGNYSLIIVGLEPGKGGAYNVRAWQGEPAFAPGTEPGGPDHDAEGVQMIQAVMDGDDIALEDGRYFAFHPVELTAGTTYTIDVASDQFDAVGYLFDAADNQLDTNDDAPQMGTNARMTFTCETTGTYSVGVSSAKPGKTGSYQITVTPQGGTAPGPRPGGDNDVEDTPAQQPTVYFNQQVEATGDQGYFTGDIELQAGQVIVIETYGLSEGCDTILQLRKSTSATEASNDDPIVAENDDDDGLLSSRIVYTVEEAGSYYIAAGVYEDNGGQFNLVIRDAYPPKDPIVLEVEIEKDGQVLLGDFSFDTEQNIIVIDSVDLAQGVDTVIELRKTVDPDVASEDDPVIATNDDFFTNDLSSRLYFLCEEPGLYYLRVQNIGKNSGTCTIRIRFEQ